MGARSTPSAPSTPGFDYGRAEEIVKRAYERQKEVTKELGEKGAAYETKREAAQSELDRLFGRGGSEALALYEKAFSSEVPALESKFETKQREFEPSLLDFSSPTSSFNLLTDALRGGASEYGTAMGAASRGAASQLYAALAAPVEGFEAIANRPAFNKLYDPTYMERAKKPPTISSDVDSFKSLYTYNV